MTKHNLEDHLTWLLNRGPSLYPSLGLLGNAGNGNPRSGRASQAISPNPQVTTSVTSSSSSFAPSRSHVAPTAVPNTDHTHIPQGDGIAVTSDNNMARLQFAPQSTSKPRMLSRVNGTPPPRTPTASAQRDPQGSHSRAGSWKKAEGQLPNSRRSPGYEPARKTLSHRETGYVNPPSPLADIDSIDLTGDLDDQDSSSATVEAFGESRLIWREDSASRAQPLEPLIKRGKKRKSDEYKSDIRSPGKLGPRVNSVRSRLGSDDFDDFVAIDDLDHDLEFQDARTGETPSSGENKDQEQEKQPPQRTIRDSEDEDEDVYDMYDDGGMVIDNMGADSLDGIEINNELYPKLSNQEPTGRSNGSNRPTSAEGDDRIESRNTSKPASSGTPFLQGSPAEDTTKYQHNEPFKESHPEGAKNMEFPISADAFDKLQKLDHEYAKELVHNAEAAYEKVMEGLDPPPALINRNKTLKSKISAIEQLRSEKTAYDSSFLKMGKLKKTLIEGFKTGDGAVVNSEDMNESRKLAQELQSRVVTARELLTRIGPLDFVSGEMATQTPSQHTLVAGTQVPAIGSEPVKKSSNWSTNYDARSLGYSRGASPFTEPRNGTGNLLFNRDPNSAFDSNQITSPSKNCFVNGSANCASSRPLGTNLAPIREDRMQNTTMDADEFMWDDGEDIFSRNMGGPSLSRFEAADFDHDADDNDLLEAAEIFERRRLTQENRPHDRPVFSETSGNISRPPAHKKSSPYSGTLDGARQYPWSNEVQAALTGRFRLRGFRHNQLEAINATLDGKDTFVLMPTGGGKSLCYQLPSIITCGRTRGVTLVVSPLLSLMEDQVAHLKRLNIRATLINGEVAAKDRREIFDTLQGPGGDEKIQLLYVTPEMVNKSNNIIKAFHNLHKNKKLARIVIDEAHCVSQWGHDFRPDYKMLGDVRTEFPGVPVMALTATATENVKADIIHNLRIPDCQVFTQSFNRPNLTYEVLKKAKGANILTSIAEKINSKYKRQSGIVYCLSRKGCEGIAKKLQDQYGINAAYYHAGMEPDERASVQKDWQCGKFHVIVATIAFGMGIDKPDVRFVIHHSMPKSLEGYYQETGRAGRDGKLSGCYLYYGFHDTSSLRQMINKSEGSEEQKQRQHQMLRNVVQFCENQSDCRRVQVLAYFNERFQRENCKRSCDNCKSDATFETRDFTQHAVLAMKLVKSLLREKAKGDDDDDDDERKKKYLLSLLYCVDLFRGANPKKLTDREITQLEGFGAGADLERGNTQRLFQHLLIEDALAEDNRVNGRGFALNYLTMGPRASDFASGRRPVKFQVRLFPEKSRQAKKKNGTRVAAARDEYPESTNVSSPARSSRNRIQRTRAEDLETTEFYEEDEDSDGFPPIRERGKSTRNGQPDLGPPITNDAKLAGLDFIQRIVLDYFLDEAKKECSRIMMEKGLRNQPFPDSILRDMGIRFPQDMQQLLEIPNIDEDKVRRYGSKFLKLIREARSKYNEMKGQGTSEGPATSGRRVSNTISISSDEDYGDDDMDDFVYNQEFNQLSGGERSAYFEPEMPPPPGLSAQLSQSRADRSGPNRKSSSRGSRATSKGGQRGKRGWKGKGTGGNWKQKGTRSSNGGSTSGRSNNSKRGGGSKSSSSSRTIGLMPT